MAKSFNEHERKIITEKLVQSCEECWSKYGYKKTSVSEICTMAGISIGAFYVFYASKELLFVDTAQRVSDRFFALVDNQLPPNPTKYDFASALKMLAKELQKVEWFLSLSHEFEMLARKLPPDYLEKDHVKNIADFSLVVEKYKLRPTVDIDEMVSTLLTLMMMLHNRNLIGDRFDKSFEYIIDKTIENLFE
jgi:AcrR family transcriptional regulator